MDASKLPNLPGYSFRDPTKQNFHKHQMLAVKSNHMTESTKFYEENVDSQVVQDLARSGLQPSHEPRLTTPLNKAIPANPPAWIKFDRMVLRFYGYFQEAVHENPTENFRVRQCVIMHHLEDETTYVTEPKVENSGIPQGVFIKRHKIPKPEGGHYEWQDFGIGVNLDFYRRVFRILDCDEATRGYYIGQGVNFGSPEALPRDNFDRTRLLVNFKQAPPDAMDLNEYNEVKLGGGHPNRNLHSFIQNDRKVLSFDVMWNDTSYDGGMKFYKLNFYLSDNTMEIKELRQTNTGNETFPMMLRRMKVPKEAILTPCPALSLRNEEFYTAGDLMIGNTLPIYGKDMILFDCDEFTRQWYASQGVIQEPIEVQKPKAYVPPNPVPPFNGYGTEEDSMGNVLRLRPNAPKADMYKIFDNDQHVLRFQAKLISSSQEDELRKFILSFYPSDDTMKVFEVVERNAGIVGGKFLERNRYKNPYTNEYFKDDNCLIGNTITLQDYRFLLTDCDEYTHSYMEERPEKFPQAHYPSILEKIVKSATQFGSRQNFLVEVLRKINPSLGNSIQYKVFLEAIEATGVRLTYQEEASLLRRWDQGGFFINIEAAYEALANI